MSIFLYEKRKKSLENLIVAGAYNIHRKQRHRVLSAINYKLTNYVKAIQNKRLQFTL